MKRYIKITLLLGLIVLLVMIRIFENDFFYDPFMQFFQNIFLGEGEASNFSAQLYFNIIIRFLLNSIISLGILYVAFKNWGIVKFAGFLYMLLFTFLFPLFIYLMEKIEPDNYLAAFYVRRFLIHPILLLLLLPAFYYQQLKGKNK